MRVGEEGWRDDGDGGDGDYGMCCVGEGKMKAAFRCDDD